MHDTMNNMKKLVFSLAAVAMAAVASVNVYNVNANAVEMSDIQKENVEALAAGELYQGRRGERERAVMLTCQRCNTNCIACEADGKEICTPWACEHLRDDPKCPVKILGYMWSPRGLYND